jgi:hypothetical protein
MDEQSTRVTSSALSMYDIMEHNVSLVENLKLNRQPFKDMDAIYFISPAMESAKRVMEDFVLNKKKGGKNDDSVPTVLVSKYGKVHMVFTGTVSFCNLFKSNNILEIKF